MDKWLEQGSVIGGAAVGRMTASDSDWQIYKTDRQAYILAVRKKLADRWEGIPEAAGMFTPHADDADLLTFLAKPGRLVSSLSKGPFPRTRDQIEGFDLACLNFRRSHPDAGMSGALYIEEKDLILPVDPAADRSDDAIVIGVWLSGGVRVPVTDTAAIHRVASWFPEEVLTRIAEDAGVAAGPSGSVQMRQAPQGMEVRHEDAQAQASARRKMPDGPFRLPGSSKLEKFFNEEIVDILRNAEEYKRMGIGFPGAVVLYGPPGTGKTFAVEKLAEFLGWPRYDINSDSVGSTYIHETGMKIARIFDMAISNAPSVVVIDEMESFLSARKGQFQHHVEEVSEFLRKIPEAAANNGLGFGMTNLLSEIDPAVLRRGRFDHMIEVGYADKHDIRALLEDRRKKLPIDDKADLDWLAGELAGKPMSDVVFVLREAGRYAVRNKHRTMTNEAFQAALRLLPAEKKAKAKIGFSV